MMRCRRARNFRASLLVIVLSCTSCVFFPSQPPLPKRAAIESTTAPRDDDRFAALVQQADIFYFPTELLGPAVSSEPAWKFVEALRKSASSFALGWDVLDGEQQPLLDEWTNRQVPIEKFTSQIRFFGSVRDRENCRAFLRETRSFGVRQLALRSPETIPAPAESVAPQFAAEKIVGYFREHAGDKLLLFIHRRDLDNTRGRAVLRRAKNQSTSVGARFAAASGRACESTDPSGRRQNRAQIRDRKSRPNSGR